MEFNFSNESTTTPPALFRTDPISIAGAVAVALVIVFTIFGNAIVCASFYTFRDLRTICNYFIISLAISDILVAVLGMPFWLILQLTDLSHNNVIKGDLYLFWQCMDIFFGTASIMNLAAVSADRHVAITAPYSYPYIMTSFRAILILCGAWIYAVIVSSLRLLDDRWPQRGGYQYFVFIASFGLPLLFMTAMYARIYIVARRQARRICRSRNYSTDVKAAKTIAVVIGVFVFCWAPFFVSVIGYINNRHFYPLIIYKCVKWLEYLNSCLNPILYTCLNKTYRRAFRRLFTRWRGRLERTREESMTTIGTLSRRLTLPRGSIFASQAGTYSTSSSKELSNGECRRKLSRKGSRREKTENALPTFIWYTYWQFVPTYVDKYVSHQKVNR